MAGSPYDTLLWQAVRSRALRRDGNRCTIARLLGGPCSARLDVHHLQPVSEGGEPYDLDNVLTACSRHHPMLEALRRAILARRERDARRCKHRHRSAEARRQCEARMARSSRMAA